MFKRCYSSFKSTLALKKPNINIKGIVSQHAEMAENMRRRGLELDLSRLEFVVENRAIENKLQNQRDSLVQKRSQLGKQMGRLRGASSQADVAEFNKVKDTLKKLKQEIGSIERELLQVSEEVFSAAESLPNWLDPSVPSDPYRPQCVDIIGGESEQSVEEALPKTEYDHKSVGEKLGLVNFSTASRISGASWYYLIGDGALLEQALVQYALLKARKAGYITVVPPSIVKSDVVHACGFKPKDQNGEKQVYAIENEPLSLTGTAEIPLGALHSSSVLTGSLPIKYVGVSRSYRAEAGAGGKDTTGLYRVHEFTKVELFHFTAPANSASELEEIRNFQTSVIADLGIKAKMLNMPTTDLGAPAMKKYDCEAWMPGRGLWGELTSCSNCGDYQSRRLGIRFKEGDKLEYAHTLNGTAMAVPRVIVAIIEQNYDAASGKVKVPEVLVPFMDGKTHI